MQVDSKSISKMFVGAIRDDALKRYPTTRIKMEVQRLLAAQGVTRPLKN